MVAPFANTKLLLTPLTPRAPGVEPPTYAHPGSRRFPMFPPGTPRTPRAGTPRAGPVTLTALSAPPTNNSSGGDGGGPPRAALSARPFTSAAGTMGSALDMPLSLLRSQVLTSTLGVQHNSKRESAPFYSFAVPPPPTPRGVSAFKAAPRVRSRLPPPRGTPGPIYNSARSALGHQTLSVNPQAPIINMRSTDGRFNYRLRYERATATPGPGAYSPI